MDTDAFEKQLVAAKLAAEAFRNLAKERPDTLLSVALTLGAMSYASTLASRHAEAAKFSREGLLALAQFLEASPDGQQKAFNDVADAVDIERVSARDVVYRLRGNYIQACENAGLEPEVALLQRLVYALRS